MNNENFTPREDSYINNLLDEVGIEPGRLSVRVAMLVGRCEALWMTQFDEPMTAENVSIRGESILAVVSEG